MDDGTIDVSHMSDAEYKAHMKELQDQAICPCNNCEPACDRASTKAICERYQAWLKYWGKQ